MPLHEYQYAATEAERAELETAIRLEAAKRAGIDPERLSVKIAKVIAYNVNNEGPYFRAAVVYATLDGHDFSEEKPERTIRWWIQQIMMAEQREPDPSRMTLIRTSL